MQSVQRLNADPGGHKFKSKLDQMTFIEIDHEIILKC